MGYQLVIVRGFGGEPYRRIVVDATAARVLVANPASMDRVQSGQTEGVWLPRSDVFEMDVDAYATLRDQWRLKGATSPATWKRLRQWSGKVHA